MIGNFWHSPNEAPQPPLRGNGIATYAPNLAEISLPLQSKSESNCPEAIYHRLTIPAQKRWLPEGVISPSKLAVSIGQDYWQLI